MKTRYEAEVDPSDDESLKKFFDDHYDYTTLELRLKYNIPTSTLNTWRRRVNRQKDRPKPFKNYIKETVKVEKILDPKIWDNGPWFKEMYVKRKIGAYVIARMINRSAIIVYRRLKRYGIELRSHKEALKPRSKYYNKQWLWENYIYHHKPIKQIVKETGVSYYTIYNWLAEFGIPIRDNAEYSVIKYRKERVARYKRKNNGTSLQKTTRKVNQSSSS